MAGGRDLTRDIATRKHQAKRDLIERAKEEDAKRTKAERKAERSAGRPSQIRKKLLAQSGPKPVFVKMHRAVYEDKMLRNPSPEDKLGGEIKFNSKEAHDLAVQLNMTAEMFDEWDPGDPEKGFSVKDVQHIHKEENA